MNITEVTPQSATDKNGMQVTLFYVSVLDVDIPDYDHVWLVGTPIGIWMEDDGTLKMGRLLDLKFDYRFDGKLQKWIDVSPGPLEPRTTDADRE